MNNNFYEPERSFILGIFDDEIKNGLVTVDDSDTYYMDKLFEQFPFSCDFVSWDSVPNSIVIETSNGIYYNDQLQIYNNDIFCKEAKKFLNKIWNKIELKNNDKIILIGEFGLAIHTPIDIFETNIEDILSESNHLFVIPQNLSWCVYLRIGYRMAFGFSP